MRIALVSDIHANLTALEATLADIAAQSVDSIVCLGDIVGYNASPVECLRLVRERAAICVAGNHDLAVCGAIGTEDFSARAARSVAWTRRHLAGDDLAYLGGLPRKAVVGGRLIAVHGALHPDAGCESVRLDNEEQRLLSFQALMAHPSGARICAFGHTHRAGVWEFRDGAAAERPGTEVRLRDDAWYLVNPGTVGEPRDGDRRAAYMVLDFDARTITMRRVAYDAQLPVFAARAAGLVPRLRLAGLQRKLRRLLDA